MTELCLVCLIPFVGFRDCCEGMGAESRRLYVGNLFPEVTDEDIKKR